MNCSDWKMVKLESCAVFKNGKKIKEDKRKVDGKYKIYGSNGIIGRTDEALIENQSIIIGRVGAYCGAIEFSDESVWVTDNAISCVNKENTDIKFLYYLLTTIPLREMAGGSAQPLINQSILNNIEIKIPGIEEQKRISDILYSLDKKIILNNEMNKTLEEMAQVLFKRWFVDFEFPNEEGKPYKSSGEEMVDSELGMIPKNWNYGSLADISEKIYSGGTPKTSEESYWNGELSWMSSGETRDNFIIKTDKKITNIGVQKSSTKLSNKYDTVIASAGQGLTRGQTSLLFIDTYINQSLICIKAKKEFAFFNYINLKTRYEELRAISDSHSIRGSLTTKMISKMQTIIPTESTILKFNEIVSPILNNIESNLYQREELIEMRDLLLPKLMNGEIRLDDLKADL